MLAHSPKIAYARPMESFITQSREETITRGKQLALQLRPGSVVTFQGDLGAGKTTFIQGVLEGLGAPAPYPSPTFVLMNQYDLAHPTASGIVRVYHVDAYRVGAEDFAKLGFHEWCTDPSGLVLLEWPERLVEMLPAKYIRIEIKSISESERSITIEQS